MALGLPLQHLVQDHFGEYVMIDPASERYLIAPTVSEVHAEFIEIFGTETRGHCLRIGSSPFMTAEIIYSVSYPRLT